MSQKSGYRFSSALFALAILASPESGAGLVGAPFKVNASSSANLNIVGAAPNGETAPLYASGSSGFIRRYSANGTDLTGSDFFVGTSANGVAFARNGNFVVVRTAADGDGQGIYARVLNRSGATVVPEFVVNSNTFGDQTGPLVNVDQAGGFAVTWYQTSNSGIYTKRFNSNGGTTMADTEVAAGLSSVNLSLGSVAMDAAGNYLVGWVANPRTTADAIDVWIRRFPAGGSPSAAIRASVTTANVQDGIRIGMDGAGDTVVVWESYQQDGSEDGVFARRFSPTFLALGTEFRVNTTVAGTQNLAGIGVADDGSFIVSWVNDNRRAVPSSIPNVGVQQYNANGTPFGGEIFISPTAGTVATLSSVAADPAGNALIAWQQGSSAGNNVFAQRFVLDTLPPVTPLGSGQTVAGLGAAAGSFKHFRLFIPAGTTSVSINLTGPSGSDADLYIRSGALPTISRWDIRPQIFGNNESIVISNPPAGELYISVYGQTAYSGVALTATTH